MDGTFKKTGQFCSAHMCFIYTVQIYINAFFFSSCTSNPDLRRSELSLDAMLQRTSSNSSSSSSPSSQGGSAERRGTKTHLCMTHRNLNWTYVRTHTHTGKWICWHTIKKKKTAPVVAIVTQAALAPTVHIHLHSQGFFRGYQRDDVSRSSALINTSDVPCCTQPPER